MLDEVDSEQKIVKNKFILYLHNHIALINYNY